MPSNPRVMSLVYVAAAAIRLPETSYISYSRNMVMVNFLLTIMSYEEDRPWNLQNKCLLPYCILNKTTQYTYRDKL